MKVSLREDFLKKLPFSKLQSRLVVAKVLSYFGDSDQVYYLMQTTSHRTRAYITNASGLKGFLVRGVISILKEAESSGELKKVTRY